MGYARFRTAGISIVAVCALLVPTRASAQLQFTLDFSSLLGQPGSTLTYSGTLTNTGSTELFLNNNSYSLAGNFLTVDESPFFDNFPVSLLGGETASGNLFTVLIGANETTGPHTGSFSILGGATEPSQTTLATQTFTVNVGRPSAAPEPGSLALLLPVLGTAGMALRRRRSRTLQNRP
ncbi:MAG: PEP-CTERM sorting domain-containing protein [Armatimonadota bacterium]